MKSVSKLLSGSGKSIISEMNRSLTSLDSVFNPKKHEREIYERYMEYLSKHKLIVYSPYIKDRLLTLFTHDLDRLDKSELRLIMFKMLLEQDRTYKTDEEQRLAQLVSELAESAASIRDENSKITKNLNKN